MYKWFRRHTKDGLELPDPTPKEVVLDRPLTLSERILQFTKNEAIQADLRNNGIDTFDEADDLEVPDDMDEVFGKTPYEDGFLGEEMPHVKTRLDEIKSGMVEEMPLDRQEKAKELLKPRKAEKVPNLVKDEVK